MASEVGSKKKSLRGSYKWPKELPPLSAEQKWINDDFMRVWHEALGRGLLYKLIERFNHGYPVNHAPAQFLSTLELGTGLGEQLEYEKLSPAQAENYYGVDIRPNMLEELKANHPEVKVVCGDCQTRLDFADDYFDRILAIHVLEHLPNLPAAVEEIARLCNKSHGTLSVVLPCEGGMMYGLGRLVSAKRIFMQRYKQSYDWFVDREHVNTADEVVSVLKRHFEITNTEYFPFRFPSLNLNLCVGLTLRPKK